ncbi:MAG: DUF2254 domain-containing protein [Caulobacteraceae bacterium]|nr:DUF2254 domain-containing protein [Caulobacteraceae bacterium]
MSKDWTILLRETLYAFRGGFLLRPFAIAVALGLAGLGLSTLEELQPSLSGLAPRLLFPSGVDPQLAQTLLSDIATSIMTVVSIVFAILLMTLTLASTQFSPRILVSFVRDRVTQWTLGMFLGTFSYCIAVLPAALEKPVPLLALAGSMVLATVCIGWLIYFIQHISNAISVNNIVDRIRRETESVIDEMMPHSRALGQITKHEAAHHSPLNFAIVSHRSGYIRYVDIRRLLSIAKAHGICLRLERRVGHFVPEGVVVMRTSHGERVSDELKLKLLGALDIGATRSMQQDVEFGIVQIVDIALRAMSPAVNDPTTAISCVDQLTSIMIRWLSRHPPQSLFYAPPNVLRIIIHQAHVDGLLDLAFEQIRHYGSADAAVSLRLMRAFCDIADTVSDPEIRRLLRERGARLFAGCAGSLEKHDLGRLQQRLTLLNETSLAAAGF